MKKLLLMALFLPAICLGQKSDTIAKGNRIHIKQDPNLLKGYYIQREKNATKDTIKITKDVFDNLVNGGDFEGQFPQASPPRRMGFQMAIDQDAFISSSNNDQDYTMGGLLTLVGQRNKPRVPFHNLSADLNAASQTNYSFGFSAFTPYRLDLTTIDQTDRPYAALAFLSYSEVTAFGRKILSRSIIGENGFRFTLLLGSMGHGISRAAQFIQTGIHSGQRVLSDDPSTVRPDPQGWKYAIGYNNNFPIIINYNADYGYGVEKKLADFKSMHPFKLYVKPSVGFAIGDLYDYLQTGVQLQAGLFGDNTFKNSQQNVVFDKHGKKIRDFGISIVGEVFGQYWAHNATLNGLLFAGESDAYNLDYTDMRHFTGFYNLGGELAINNVRIGISRFVRSEVVKGAGRDQVFGRVILKVGI